MNIRLERFLDNLKFVHAVRAQRGEGYTRAVREIAYDDLFPLDNPNETRDDNKGDEFEDDAPRLEPHTRRR